MLIHCLSTGSDGNCYIVEYEPHKAFMLDCGITGHRIIDYCNKNNLGNMPIDFCLISHYHTDHLKDETFICNSSSKIYVPREIANKEIYSKINKKNADRIESCKNYINIDLSLTLEKFFVPKNCKNQEITGFKIYPFKVCHDEEPTLGYKIILPNGKKMVYITDFGVGANEQEPFSQTNPNGILPELPTFEEKIDLIMIECNWDPKTISTDRSQIAQRSKKQHCSTECCKACLENYFIGTQKIRNSNVLLLHRSNDRLKIENSPYKLFRELECKDCRPIYNNYCYEYDDNMNLVSIINTKTKKIIDIEKTKLNMD